MNKKCKICGIELVVGINWYPSHQKSRKYQCNSCYKIYKQTQQNNNTVFARRKYIEVRTKILELLGNKCSQCGFKHKGALQVHHINGNGTEERKMFGRDLRRYYRFVLSKIVAGNKEYGCLCANCNAIIEWNKFHYKAQGKQISRQVS